MWQRVRDNLNHSNSRRYRLARWIRARLYGLFGTDRSPRERAGSLLGLLMAGAALIFVFLISYTLMLIPFTPSVKEIKKAKIDRPAIVLYANGEELARIRRMNREWVGLKDISPNVVKALIATEDHRFYDHHGIDFIRVLSATYHTALGDLQGGSTLSQQLARNLYPEEIGFKDTITRKIREMITAFKLEYTYSKPEILEIYLNTVPFLYNAWGIEMAARTYFDKSARELTILESATLVGMLKGNSIYNPVLHPERSKLRRNVVLRQMVKYGDLSESQYKLLSKKPIRLQFERQNSGDSDAPHLTAWIKSWLIGWADENNFDIYTDGLVVQTSIQPRLQMMATRAVERQARTLQGVAEGEWRRMGAREKALITSFIRESAEYAALVDKGTDPAEALAGLRRDKAFVQKIVAQKVRLEAGFVAIAPKDGTVLAWVGGKDFSRGQYDHVGRARRQPGSTFKPFAYAAALEAGINPGDRFPDRHISYETPNGPWTPTDLTPPTGRMWRMEDGLVHSKNTVTAQVADRVGPRKVAAVARRLGVESRLEEVPSLALGTSPVTLLEMTAAYAGLANDGKWQAPRIVTRIQDSRGRTLEEFVPKGRQALSRDSAGGVVDMMRGVIERGTGRTIRTRYGITLDVAGKTGTTQDNTDGWFILMHRDIVAGAWVGFDDPRVRIQSAYWGQGANSALPLVGDFFRQAQAAGLARPGAMLPGRRSFVDRYMAPVIDEASRILRGAMEEIFPGGGAADPAPPDLAPVMPVEPAGPLLPAPAPEPSRSGGGRDPERTEKDLERVRKETEKELGRARKETEKELERARKEAEKALERARKESEKALERARKEAERLQGETDPAVILERGLQAGRVLIEAIEGESRSRP